MDSPGTERPDAEETNNDSNRSHLDSPPEHHKRRRKRHHRQRKKRAEAAVQKTNNSTGAPPELPPELHEIIIDELEGEEDALKQCALTCRLYRHLAQRLLFKSVELQFEWSFNRVYNLLEILNASPHIADYVKRLCVYQDLPYVVPKPGAQSQARPDNPFSLVLPALINLDDVVIRRNLTEYDFPRSLQFMAKCENLVSLTMVQFYDIPSEIFNHLQRLEKLNLENVCFLSDGPNFKYVTKIYPCQLKHMELEDVYIQTYIGTDVRHIYHFFVERTFGLGGLESFRIIIMEGSFTESPPDFEAAKSLIRSNSASLKVLDVMITGSEPVILPNDEPVFDISKMPLLEEWTLGGVFYIGGGGAEAVPISLGWLSRHLETIPAGKRFKSITIRPRMYQVYNVMDLVWDVESLKYFENLIVEKALPSTKSLSVDFIIVAPFDYEEPVKQLLRKLLPTLYELNLLKFSYD